MRYALFNREYNVFEDSRDKLPFLCELHESLSSVVAKLSQYSRLSSVTIVEVQFWYPVSDSYPLKIYAQFDEQRSPSAPIYLHKTRYASPLLKEVGCRIRIAKNELTPWPEGIWTYDAKVRS